MHSTSTPAIQDAVSGTCASGMTIIYYYNNYGAVTNTNGAVWCFLFEGGFADQREVAGAHGLLEQSAVVRLHWICVRFGLRFVGALVQATVQTRSSPASPPG